MANQLRELIKAQKYFYRDNYRRSCNVFAVLLCVIFVLALTDVYLYAVRPLPDFYASSSSGDLAQLTPMDTPNYSHTPLIK